MSVSYQPPHSPSERDARRAAAAYRMAGRLGRTHSRGKEWERLCIADRERRALRPFADLFDGTISDDDIIDVEFVDIPDPEGKDHIVRSAYLLAAVTAGTLCLLIGGVFLI